MGADDDIPDTSPPEKKTKGPSDKDVSYTRLIF